MADILERIFTAKAKVRQADEAREPFDSIRRKAFERVSGRRNFARALRPDEPPALIGEIKRASPSAGLLTRDFDPQRTARVYDAAGIDAISVITEADHFLGDLAYLDIARAQTSRPVLRKDFLSTPYEIAQSAAYGADAVLLIVAALDDSQLRVNMSAAAEYALDVLVEVHDAAELERAVNAGASIIGINNRDLRTFETDLATSEYLIPKVPAGVTIVTESGIHGPGDIRRLLDAGAHAFLVGEMLMRAGDPARAIGDLRHAVRRSSVS